jgi:cell division protein FtsL
MKLDRIILLLLALAVVASAVMVAFQRQESRRLFYALEQLNSGRDEANIQWGRLKLEQATWSENSRIEQIARQDLGLTFPAPEQVVVIGR